MAVAHDAITDVGADFTGSTAFNHTPAGTPKGVLVWIAQNVASADEISAVTYGGVAMSRLEFARDTATEPMAAYVYFLGSGIPTGTQSVSITTSASAGTKRAWCQTLTATGNTAVEDSNLVEALAGGGLDDPSIVLTTAASQETWAGGLLMSGLGVTTDITAPAGFTEIGERDFGQQTCSIIRLNTNDAGGNVTVQWTTGAADDYAAVAVAVKESAAVNNYVLDCQPGSFGTTGVAATLAAGRVFDAQPASYTVTGSAATTSRGYAVNAEPGSYTVTGTAATTLTTRLIAAEPGSYAITGEAASVVAGRVVSADPGVYTLTGVAADLVYTPTAGAFTLNLEPGSFTVAGAASSVVADRVIAVDPAAYLVTGATATPLAARLLGADAGTFTLAGIAAGLTWSGEAPIEHLEAAFGATTGLEGAFGGSGQLEAGFGQVGGFEA